jgi:hypothetical protein
MLRQTSTSKSSWPNWPANNKRYPGAFAPKLESATKKLLVLRVLAMSVPPPAGIKSFFVSFFSKKEALT